MNKKRSKHHWPNIFTEQEQSGLTIAEFCTKHKISPFSFYLNKQRQKNSNFVQAKVVTLASEPNTQLSPAVPAIKLMTPAGELSLPCTTSASFLVSVIKALS